MSLEQSSEMIEGEFPETSGQEVSEEAGEVTKEAEETRNLFGEWEAQHFGKEESEIVISDPMEAERLRKLKEYEDA